MKSAIIIAKKSANEEARRARRLAARPARAAKRKAAWTASCIKRHEKDQREAQAFIEGHVHPQKPAQARRFRAILRRQKAQEKRQARHDGLPMTAAFASSTR